MDRPLSIVIPIHSFEPGGVERVGLNLARSWHEAGHAVTIVLGRDEGLDRAQAPALDYALRPSPVPTAAVETLWMIWVLWRYLRRHRPDVLFCAGNTYAVVCVAMRLFLGRRCPVIVAKISNDLVRRDRPWIYRQGYHLWLRVQGALFARQVGMAPPMRAEIAGMMGVADDRIAIVSDPALSAARLDQLLAIARHGRTGDAMRFVAVGRLVAQKNLALLLRAFAQGAAPQDSLTVVGDGPERGALEAQARRLGLGGRVHFAGHLPSPDQQLRAADCLLLSSDYEGVPAVVIEAIAAGLPVIATDCSLSMPELLGHGARGVLVPIGDQAALAAAIGAASRLPVPGPEQRRYAAAYVVEEARDRYVAVMRGALDQAGGNPVPSHFAQGH